MTKRNYQSEVTNNNNTNNTNNFGPIPNNTNMKCNNTR